MTNRDTYSPWTREYRTETRAAQGDGWRCPTTGAVPPPVSLGATFARDDQYRSPAGIAYLRDQGSPGYEQLEGVVAGLEGGSDALVFSSGLAAATAVFQVLPAGARVVVPETMYFGLTKWLLEFGGERGLEVVRVPMDDLDAVAGAVGAAPTALVWAESPANPTWLVTDLAACAEVAHRAGALFAVDNTVPTPVHTRPFELGADLVMHSGTKYLNGHNDVVAGLLVARPEPSERHQEFWERLRLHRRLTGPIPGPWEAYLLLRGIRTLFPRMRQISATALTLAEHFQGHPLISKVAYPGLPGDPGHEIASRQMTGGYSGMLSLHVAGDWQRSLRAAEHCELFIRATSLGGVESLIEHRYTFEGPDSTSPKDMLRLSIGLEDPADLVADLEEALERAAKDVP
ncbi:PLP-dependent aspartate aminotransferase family protein [Streptomyces sp. LP05-1]|uniref:PLP-dependent aspartate aminotransferase family protein n=1 Tax=Streptomyces pyxinae TaxID=2970734 RepID=A0ABT2CL74_9ACTN|nr:PLP-dependent aspartate aminotransferase family protein [Streptomyces sp. LP05-1]MCS0638174.1 PLP-dependent aspartate aminotransferase family protein [Streptomyces sp. LP05-1]